MTSSMPEKMTGTALLQRILSRLEAFDTLDAGVCVGIEDGEVEEMTETWLTQFNRTQALHDGVSYNEMHAYGIGVCALLHRTNSSVLSLYDPEEELEELKDKLFIDDCVLNDMSCTQLQDVVTSVQIEFASLFESSASGAHVCKIDLPTLMRCVMQRLGALLCNKFRSSRAEDVEKEGLNPCLSVNEQGWCEVREEAVRALLLGIHVILVTHRLLSKATHVPRYEESPPEEETPRDYHREASLDEFYELDMIMTVPLGSIVQYRDKFRYLFHSVSQVVYFHFPSFQRSRQLSMLELEHPDTHSKSILPLLLQIDPTIPILYEHTGAGCLAIHAEQKYSWTVLGPFVILTDAEMNSFTAKDIRTLLQFKLRQDKALSILPHA